MKQIHSALYIRQSSIQSDKYQVRYSLLMMGTQLPETCREKQFTKMTNKMQLCRIIYCSTCFERYIAQHQEHLNCMYSFWYYSHASLPAGIGAELLFSLDTSRQRHMRIIPEAVHTVQMLLMMRKYIARNMQSSQETINYPTQLHLVGYLRELYHNTRNFEYQVQRKAINTFRKLCTKLVLFTGIQNFYHDINTLRTGGVI